MMKRMFAKRRVLTKRNGGASVLRQEIERKMPREGGRERERRGSLEREMAESGQVKIERVVDVSAVKMSVRGRNERDDKTEGKDGE